MAMKGGAPRNLKPVRTKEEAKRRGKNGGIASGEARREKKLFKEAIEKMRGTSLEEAAENLWNIAKDGRRPMSAIRAFEVLRDTSDEKPTDKVELSKGLSDAEIEEHENEIAAIATKKNRA